VLFRSLSQFASSLLPSSCSQTELTHLPDNYIDTMKSARFFILLRPANKLLILLLLISSTLLYFLKTTTLRLRGFHSQNLVFSNSTSAPLSIVDILLLNGHSGTSLDFQRIATHLNFTYQEISPRSFTPYGQSGAEARFLEKTIGVKICATYKYVVVIDTNPDARFLLQMMLENNCPNVRKVLMITTNRFDFDVIDYWDYYNLIRRVGRRLEDRVLWVSNNPWESRYAQLKLGGDYIKFRMIRPFGYSSLSGHVPKPSDSDLPVIFNYENVAMFSKVMENVGIPFKLLPKKYGGPSALANYKALITIPYQASTMKMYENIAHGVTMLVPSPRLLSILITQPGYELSAAGGTFEAGSDGYKYIEFYSTDLSHFFYQFDSLEELREILQRDVVDVRNVRENGPKYWDTVVRSQGRRMWKQVFEDLFSTEKLDLHIF